MKYSVWIWLTRVSDIRGILPYAASNVILLP